MNAICSSPEAVGQPQRPEAEALAISAARLAVGLERSINQLYRATHQNHGSIELAVEKESRELLRQATEKAAQQKAEATPPICPVRQHRLSRLSTDHARTFESKFGPITVRRARGYCRRCRKWRFPADTVLGLEETAGYSPRVQEMAALLASKMPVAEASAVLEHLPESSCHAPAWIGKHGGRDSGRNVYARSLMSKPATHCQGPSSRNWY